MTKKFILTNDNFNNGFKLDSYYCENPTDRDTGFRICVDKVNELFPDTVGKETIVVTISTKRRHKKGEVAVRRNYGKYLCGGIPYISIRGETIQLLNQTLNNVGVSFHFDTTLYVTVSPKA